MHDARFISKDRKIEISRHNFPLGALVFKYRGLILELLNLNARSGESILILCKQLEGKRQKDRERERKSGRKRERKRERERERERGGGEK